MARLWNAFEANTGVNVGIEVLQRTHPLRICSCRPVRQEYPGSREYALAATGFGILHEDCPITSAGKDILVYDEAKLCGNGKEGAR